MATKSKLQAVLEKAGLTTRSCSGRGMDGKRCLAVEFRRTAGLLSALMGVDMSYSDRAETAKALLTGCEDSMGHDTVLYFPGTPFVGEESPDDPDME